MAENDQTRSFRVRSLSPADGNALDALLQARAGQGGAFAAGSDQADRTQRVQQLLSMLDAAGPSEDETAPSVEETMQAIHAQRQRQRFQSQVQMLTDGAPRGGLGWGQVAASVAAVAVSASLLLPVLDRNQAEAHRFACMSNLQNVGQAIDSYANHNQGHMPRGVEAADVWWNVGQLEQNDPMASIAANAGHLYTLYQQGYVEQGTLACTANEHAGAADVAESEDGWPDPAAVAYSYQRQQGEPMQVDAYPHMAIVADKNPLFVVEQGRVAYDETTPWDTPSRAHDNRGQSILFADGRVVWQVSPEIERPGHAEPNNIWMADAVSSRTAFTGHEAPSNGDSFLVP